MKFRLFSLYPQIFTSFLETSLIARGLSQNIISVEICNWRENYGIGSYRQVDDRPFGGGTGMVLVPQPIVNALKDFNALSPFFESPETQIEHSNLTPPNVRFWKYWLQNKPKKATISLTPRGYPLTQQIVEWLTNFDELNIVCGRFEGFDARVSEAVDLELSVGDFVLNGGEVAGMALMESVSRLVPGFVTKAQSVEHDSFSSGLNNYREQSEYVIGTRKIRSHESKKTSPNELLDSTLVLENQSNLFDEAKWLQDILPRIEHPHYTRPEVWENWRVPEVLIEGNHKLIQAWRHKWY